MRKNKGPRPLATLLPTCLSCFMTTGVLEHSTEEKWTSLFAVGIHNSIFYYFLLFFYFPTLDRGVGISDAAVFMPRGLKKALPVFVYSLGGGVF